jgi:hypothetical protein
LIGAGSGSFRRSASAQTLVDLAVELVEDRHRGSGRSKHSHPRTLAADALIVGVYLAGTNTRRVRRALAALFGGTVGKDTVSRTWRKVKSSEDAQGSGGPRLGLPECLQSDTGRKSSSPEGIPVPRRSEAGNQSWPRGFLLRGRSAAGRNLVELVHSCALLAVVGWLILRASNQRGLLQPLSASSLAAAPRLAVIVPARDEEANIGRCLRGLVGRTIRRSACASW